MHHAGAEVERNIRNAICRSRNKCAFTQTAARLKPTRSLLKHRIKLKKQGERRAQHRSVDAVAEKICIGMSTAEIDQIVYDFTTKHGGIPAPLNYEGFPKSVCTSLNNEVCHGIPDKDIILKKREISSMSMYLRS